MYRLLALAVVAALAVVVSATATGTANAADPTIEDIMKEAHSGKKSLRNQVQNAVKAEKWGDASKSLEKWVKLASALGKNKPPEGGTDSWKKLTEEYEKSVKSLAAAVKGKKEEDAKEALTAIGKGCKACHDVHQKKE